MEKTIKIGVVVVGILLGLVMLVWLIGAALPVQHVARASATFRCSVDEVWRQLTAYADYPRWRRGLRELQQTGATTWKEIDSEGEAVSYEIVEVVPLRRLVRRIAEKNLPYGGSWTIELERVGAEQVAITITENGEVYNPIFRFVSKFVLGHHSTMAAFLEDFGKSVSQSAAIRKS